MCSLQPEALVTWVQENPAQQAVPLVFSSMSIRDDVFYVADPLLSRFCLLTLGWSQNWPAMLVVSLGALSHAVFRANPASTVSLVKCLYGRTCCAKWPCAGYLYQSVYGESGVRWHIPIKWFLHGRWLQLEACTLPGVLVRAILRIPIEKGLLCPDHVV